MIPKLTQNFEEYLSHQTTTYRLDIDGIPIDIFPNVFPPRSPYSESTSIYEGYLDVEGKSVLDIGTGSGILAILCAKNGARHVDAVDISEDALACAIHNSKLNDARVDVYYSDIFSHVSRAYDLILANLPILNLPYSDTQLYDFSFACHERLFRNARNHLNRDGAILITHADLISDFDDLEKLISTNNYQQRIVRQLYAHEHEWRLYEVKL